MTAREYRRIRGYVRAQARKEAFGKAIGWRPSTAAERGMLSTLTHRECVAYERLPERARAAIQNPAQ